MRRYLGIDATGEMAPDKLYSDVAGLPADYITEKLAKQNGRGAEYPARSRIKSNKDHP